MSRIIKNDAKEVVKKFTIKDRIPLNKSDLFKKLIWTSNRIRRPLK
jgi:hypothetical protein